MEEDTHVSNTSQFGELGFLKYWEPHHLPNSTELYCDYPQSLKAEDGVQTPKHVLPGPEAGDDGNRVVHTKWHRRVGSATKNIPSENSPAVSNDMHLYTTRSQGGEMLQCAKEVADRASGRHLPFNEFRSFTKELKRTNERSHPRQLGKIQDRNGQEKKKKSRKMSKNNVTHDVFLGGSCNPTTWRHDVAIPLLESCSISYYNPQVSEWNAELVQVEHRAKASAKILFYVLDKQTRNVVGIVEAAHFAGARRNLVLVIDNYEKNQLVAGESISKTEFEELSCGLATLQDLVKRQDIPVFNSIPVAIKCTSEFLHTKLNDRNNKTNNFQAKYNNVHVRDKLPSVQEMFEALDTTGCGEISLNEFCRAYQHLTKKKLSVSDLNGIVSGRKDDNIGCRTVNYEQFRALVTELKIQNGMSEKWLACCSKVPPTNYSSQYSLDIYVGGSCFDFAWKQQVAVPILEKSGLRFRLAECGSQSSSRAGPSEAEAMDSCCVLLFVITSNTRGLETMAMASYYIGLGRNVILCIQELPEGCIIYGEKLTKVAVSDYNRGRYYLVDEADRRNVPVFQNVADAVRCAVDKCFSISTACRR